MYLCVALDVSYPWTPRRPGRLRYGGAHSGEMNDGLRWSQFCNGGQGVMAGHARLDDANPINIQGVCHQSMSYMTSHDD